MLREIYEQPDALLRTFEQYCNHSMLRADRFAPLLAAFGRSQRIVIAASGSSRHAGLSGEIILEDLAGLVVDVEYASEWSYRSTHTIQAPATIVISQSGETADTLQALRAAISRGLITIAITNAATSTMAREATISLPTYAGVEKAIPATKSFTTQLQVLFLTALSLGLHRGTLDEESVAAHLRALQAIPSQMAAYIARWDEQVRGIVAAFSKAKTFLFLGRAVHYAIAREGALKLKESAYLQAEGYPTGELKHGPNALVSNEAPLVVIATRDVSSPDSQLRYEKTIQLIRDMRTQGATIFALANEGDEDVRSLADHCIFVPSSTEYLLPILEIVPLQLFAYHSAILRGIDVDNPRNLVKAVITE
jgi:glucosamine--fructose-6-phosphate aminotransferase (isomerizing)